MQNPFEPALRVQRRALDAIRVSLIAELARENVVDARLAALDGHLVEEATVVAGNWQVMSFPYTQRQKQDRAGLEKDRAAIAGSLGRLRDATMEACGQMQAISLASAAFSADRYRNLARSEQAAADDFAGARFAGRRGTAARR